MDTPLISVIIPIYNSEQYLDYCLASVLVQKYKNLEIICINDGSTDNSLRIIEKYSKNDSRIKIINQQNQGQSIARNNGMKHATGEWISFVDSDDWINMECYQRFVECLNQSPQFTPDVYVFNGAWYPQNDILLFNIKDWTGSNPHKFEDCNSLFGCNMSVWNKIYRREFLIENNLLFSPNIIFEDQLFTISALVLAKEIYVTDDIMYWYRQHKNSTMHSLENNAFDVFKSMNEIEQLLKTHELWETKKYALLQHRYTWYVWILKQLPVDIKSKFYEKVKEEFLNNNDYDENIISNLKNSQLYFDFRELEMKDFVKKYS